MPDQPGAGFAFHQIAAPRPYLNSRPSGPVSDHRVDSGPHRLIVHARAVEGLPVDFTGIPAIEIELADVVQAMRAVGNGSVQIKNYEDGQNSQTSAATISQLKITTKQPQLPPDPRRSTCPFTPW